MMSGSSKYSASDRRQTKSLLNLYFESEGMDKEDGLHEIMLEFLSRQNKTGVTERDRPYLEKLRDLQNELKRRNGHYVGNGNEIRKEQTNG